MLQRTIVPDVQQIRQELAEAPWLKGSGTIVYDPNRQGMKRKTEWWCILRLDRKNDLAAYYRNWVKMRYGYELCQQSWEPHVSILRGEKPKHHLMHLWKKYNGQRVQFEYQPYVRYSGDTSPHASKPIGSFWFVDVRSKILTDIRDELELPSQWNQHLTVGRQW
ncbi:hypothetical protein NVP2275O_340 [Vibrio phage 2.275.O._10N.286.54.E11]|nr:hypothetical protein NVP2275O_340 [Vibrio phage 2.275.O._10N.286.54.E11]